MAQKQLLESSVMHTAMLFSHLSDRKVFEVVLAVIFILTAEGAFLGQERGARMQEEILRMEKDFGQAVIKNDAGAVGQFLTDYWIIIDPDGSVIGKARFLDIIRSGALTHGQMDPVNRLIRVENNYACAWLA
jgi:hypothetical protein